MLAGVGFTGGRNDDDKVRIVAAMRQRPASRLTETMQHGLDIEATRQAIKAMLHEQPVPLRGAT